MRSLLLVDDQAEVVNELADGLRRRLSPDEVVVRTWIPSADEPGPREVFGGKVDDDTLLVVTDSDLTGHGQTGLFGESIVAWCQQQAIPVADYSRKPNELPKAPDLFELRVPSDPDAATQQIAALFQGFKAVNDTIMQRDDLLKRPNHSSVLAEVLGKPEIEDELALYSVRFGATSGALVDRFEKHRHPSDAEKRKLLTYIVSHMLLIVLRFAGPILSLSAMRAYLATTGPQLDDVLRLFGPAAYAGPFSQLKPYFWLAEVDQILAPMIEALPQDAEYETLGELHRAALERQLGRTLDHDYCSERCNGDNGGFYCPFTDRPVCLRSDCSVGSNSWIPQGAKLCRIERDFYDEWSPILGL